jgi:hypothetical protein
MTDKPPYPPTLGLLTLASSAFLASCVAEQSSSITPHPATTSNIAAAFKNLENNWIRCLNKSYLITRTQTADKYAAAEMALQDCSAEEQDMAAGPGVGGNLLISHLRAAAKDVLLEDGQVKLVE